MNDIEKQIEGIDDNVMEEIIDKEEDSIKGKLNRNRDNDKKKVIIYIVIGILVVALISLVIYFVFNKENNTNDDNNIDNDAGVVNGEIEESDEDVDDNIGYVSCDDNTTLLNVRNSTTGNIIDGLSCYKEVIIEEEIDGTDVCDKWYKISYTRNGNNYTGYSCGTYIKKMGYSSSVMDSVKKLIDKANDYYENNILKAYCGNSSDIKIIEYDNNMTGEYVKSEYKNIDELKKYVLSFLSESLITIKIELSDIDNPKYYDNYYEIDGNLYCRNYAGKGFTSYYTNNYDIEIVSVSDDKIDVNIAYQYLSQDSECNLDDLSNCSKSNFVYEIGKVKIENNIITKMDFHK